jgi:hypothetical protein
MARNYSQPYAVASHGGRNLVAGIFGDGIGCDEAAKAHSQLFASAPALLATLQVTLALVRLKYGNLDADVNQIIADADQAIASATGEA